jgi:hypothetical protein
LKESIKREYRDFITAVKTLSFKEVFIFMSVAIITFLSMYYAAPPFFRKVFESTDTKFYSTVYWFSADGFLMFIVPMILIFLVLKGKPSEYGFTIGDYKFGLSSYFIFMIFMIPVVWIISGNEDFAKAYPQAGNKVRENFNVLVYYELFVGFYMLAWEFFWRGYMLFGLKQKFGYYAIFIQMIPFFILHRGKPELETFASIFAGLILGVQAWRARSFLYCFLTHWTVMIFVDVISVMRYKSQSYGIGIDSFLKLF